VRYYFLDRSSNVIFGGNAIHLSETLVDYPVSHLVRVQSKTDRGLVHRMTKHRHWILVSLESRFGSAQGAAEARGLFF
jgi:hypothetical protein